METAKTMRVNKWGNSLGIRFPADFVDLVQLSEKSLVEIKADGNTLVIKKIEEKPPRKTVREMFEDFYNQDFETAVKENPLRMDEEVNWGTPVGDEIW
jgi:antitoxin MazE